MKTIYKYVIEFYQNDLIFQSFSYYSYFDLLNDIPFDLHCYFDESDYVKIYRKEF